MAGIAGTVDFRPGLPPAEPLVRAMLGALRHRGPDGELLVSAGPATLGVRALAVLDGPAPTAGAPPLLLALDADLTNVPELARELGLRDACQSEVVLAAWTRWGLACLERLEGGFAFAAWDATQRRLTCACDPLGLRPLYLTSAAGRLRFASEIRGLLADRDLPRAPDEPRLLQFLAHGLSDHDERTMVAGVRRVRGGELAVVSARDGTVSTSRWFRFAPARGSADVRALLEDAVGPRLRGGVVGATVSGGIDSTSVLATAVRLRQAAGEPPPRAILARTADPRLDEWPYVRALADRYAIPVVQVRLRDDEFVADMDDVIRSLDQPFHSPSVYGHWRVLRAAREEGIDIVLEGQGGERFGSDGSWYPHLFFDLVRHRHVARAAHEARARSLAQHVALSRSAVDLAKLLLPRPVRAAHARPPAWLARGMAVEPPPLPKRGVAANQLSQLLVSGLPVTVREIDRDASAHSLVARGPFYDLRIVRHALSLSAEEFIENGRTKAPVIRAMRGIVPDTILDRGVKQGLTVETDAWMRGALGAEIERTLAAPEARARPYWDAAELLRSVRACRAGRAPALPVWRAFCVERWLRTVVESTSP